MPLIESARSLEIRRRDILAAAAVGLAFGTSSFDAIGQESIEKGQASVGEIIAQYATNLKIRGPAGRCQMDREAGHSGHIRLRVQWLYRRAKQDRPEARE